MKKNNFEIKVIETIKKFNMFSCADAIVTAVSGGMDSVSLLHFLKEFQKNGRNIKFLSAVHFNHNLRGKESAANENFVKNLCGKFGIKLFLKSENVALIAKERKKGIEECARDLRYSFFNKIADEISAKIAVAHTISDSLETVIFNFARGSGLSGLKGIPPVRDKIIRPFIFITRSEIKNYIKQNNLEFVTDKSNFCSDFSRNRIRMFVIPNLKKINPSFEKTGERFLNQIKYDINFFDIMLKKHINKNLNEIKKLHESIRFRIIKKKLEQFSESIEFRHVKLADDLINGKVNAFMLPGKIKIIINNGRFAVCDKTFCEHLTNDDKEFIIEKAFAENSKNKYNLNEIFNLDNLILEPKFRTREPGDIFCRQGSRCTKTLKKLFNEMKIPVQTRSKIKILADGKNIIWIENIGVSEKYKITDETRFLGIIKIKF
jgi:tRNA(Ile)-lysidine synthase